ncbi:response regulator [Massilia sp. H-1]|nr:response regulator [Massilia sp. H-1]
MDDSALIRSVMSEIISSQADMEVVGVAPDPLVARELIKQTNPDVLTLDVEMPKMDGLDFLEKLMRLQAHAGADGVLADRARLGNHDARWSWARSISSPSRRSRSRAGCANTPN